MVERKIIFQCRIGSHLYGTSDAASDEDFSGVFLPSTEDLLGLQNCPTEWSMDSKKSSGPRNEAGDVDSKLFSLKQFMSLAAEGQPGQLELLFVPDSQILIQTEEWRQILVNKDLFLSKNGIRPFIGFALSQANKATVKGENLNKLREIQEWGEGLPPTLKNEPLLNFLGLRPDEGIQNVPSGKVLLGKNGIEVDLLRNDFNALLVDIAGRKYDVGMRVKVFLESVGHLIGRYGTRTEAAAAKGFDYKSLSHAVRLLGQAKEFLSTGTISLPRPDAARLLHIKRMGQEGYPVEDVEWFDMITKELDHIKQVLTPESTLPAHANRSKINELCIQMLCEHLRNNS